MSDTRSAFEAWARAQYPDIDYERHGFDPYERAAWQAACEACAKACEPIEGIEFTGEACAEACRDLAR